MPSIARVSCRTSLAISYPASLQEVGMGSETEQELEEQLVEAAPLRARAVAQLQRGLLGEKMRQIGAPCRLLAGGREGELRVVSPDAALPVPVGPVRQVEV